MQITFMVQRLVKLAEKAIGTAKNILFADPKLLFEEERHLIKQPFFFEGTNRKGIILIHGWTATPYEVRRLGKYLNGEGYSVSGPLLRGHGTKPEDLENVKWQDWVDDLLKAYDDLKKNCDQIYVGGTSIGSSLAVLLAIERPEIKGLILMAPPYKIKFEKLLEIVGKLLLPFKKYNKKYYPPTFGVSTTITRIIAYQKYSIKSSLEVLSMVRFAREKLSEVKQPVFLIKSMHDHVLGKNSLEDIYSRIGSEVKEKKYIKRAYHTFISDIKHENVFEDILNFLKKN